MRARNIKPGFFKNEDLLECDPLARILFSGLWCMADREGRLEDRPKRIKIEILPCDNCDIDDLLRQLTNHGLIIRYSLGSANYLFIPAFVEHQRPHIREEASIIPPYIDAKAVPEGACMDAKAQPRHNLGSAEGSIFETKPALPSFLPDSSSLRSEGRAPEKPPKVKIQGSRLSPDWELEQEWGDWALDQGLSDDDVIGESQKFRDYWIGKAGHSALKADWEATWRNWIREYLGRRKK